MAGKDERFGFTVDYFDSQADLIRNYQLIFYPSDNSIEMHDVKNRRPFLKRTPYPGIRLQDLYLGATITINSRQLTISAYTDDFTRSKFTQRQERTLAMIKPDAYEKMGKIIDAILKDGFTIGRMKLFHLSKEDAEEFYSVHRDRPFFRDLVAFMSSDYIVALELIGDSAIAKWRRLIGPTNTATARAEAPSSLRAKFGTDNTRNACHGSDSVENAQKEIDFFFGGREFRPTATFSNSTLALIKPHAVTAGLTGQIIDSILEDGFEISALQTFSLTKANAEDFLEVYKGVVPEFTQMVDQLTSGPVVAIEVRAESAVQAFRELCGPADSELAKVLRPKSLRARFGADKIRNAVHCTDLAEDGSLESEFFFGLLARSR